MIKLKIIIASTRDGRKGPAIADWVYQAAAAHGSFEAELLDLLKINLPFLDEPNHPRFKKYQKQHTWDWSAIIDAAEAFIVVTCEYNYGYPAALKNAFDFLFHEWTYKPVAFVSYGGPAGGTRAVQLFKPVVASMKMMPLLEAVYIPYFLKQINEAGIFVPTDQQNKDLAVMFEELKLWSEGLKTIREKKNK